MLDKDGKLAGADRRSAWRACWTAASRREQAIAAMADAVADAVDGLSRDQLQDNEELTEACRLAARRWFHKAYDKKPVTKVHVMRL